MRSRGALSALSLSLSLSLSSACGGPSGADGDADGVDAPGDTGTGDGSVPECEALIDCIKIVSPEATSSTVAAYGPEGSCFDVPGLTPEDCAAECAALRADLAQINSDVAECAALDCNDGVLGLEELCDSTPGCSATCTFSSSNLACNLLNQTGCEGEQVCWLTGEIDGVICYNGPIGSPGATVGDSCSGSYGPCGDFSMCLNHPACGGSPCCLATCYLDATEADFGACPAGSECVPMVEAFGATMLFEGTELYGLCI